MERIGRKYTFVRVANNTTNGVALGVEDQDVVVYKIIIGLPVANGVVRLYYITNPVNGATTNLAFHATLPATLRAGENQYDFGPDGIVLGEGGNIMVTEDMQVTVIWDYLG